MDIFFTRRYSYIINDSIENVRESLQSITNRKWLDFSDNIAGYISLIGNYVFTPKWSLMGTNNGSMITSLCVKLIEENDKTKIKAVLQPNAFLVLLFYLIATLFFCELVGINLFPEESKLYFLLSLPFIDLILFGLIKLVTNILKNTFERVMGLN
jgi:hypothetical protein